MSEIITAVHGSDGGHWYNPDGSPAYTIIGKNGKERNTTLADARKHNLRPSVTDIIKLAAKPGLENWKAEQILMSVLTTTRNPLESEAEYLARIKEDANAQALKARERGTLIHAWVQSGFENKVLSDEACKYFSSAKDTILNEIGEVQWTCELSFANNRYGGKIDLISESYLIDIKTTDKSLDKATLWDDHYMQLGAYRGVDSHVICGILYVNSITAESKLILAEEKEITKGLKCFDALLDFFYAKTGLTFIKG